MAYALWLYKEITNDTGKKTRLEIEKRDYSGSSYEITALSGDIVLSVDVDSPTAPIVKSTLSFAIIDTAQVTYSDFFTPDATLYRVKVYDVDGSTQTIRWTGFITPDSFGEPLTYRGEINLTARDNLGYLNDLDFDYNSSTTEQYASIKTIINAAIAKISQGSTAGGMSVTWNVQKKASTAADGTFDNIEDAIVSTYTMLGDNWGNVISELLKGIGCQLRFIDNNAFGIYDIENLSESSTFTAQSIRFLNQSGYREIQPAWKNGIFSQDYQLFNECPLGYPSTFGSNITRVKTDVFSQTNTYLMQGTASPWTIVNGGVQWGLCDSSYGDLGSDAIYVPYLDIDSGRTGIYAERRIDINQQAVPVSVKFSIKACRYKSVYQVTSGWYGFDRAAPSYGGPDSNKVYYNIVFYGDNGTVYYLRSKWMLESELEEGDEMMVAEFNYRSANTNSDTEVDITCASFPTSGDLAIRFYPPEGTWTAEINRTYHEYDCDFDMCVRISDLALHIDKEDDDSETGITTRSSIGAASERRRRAIIADAHNITDSEDYIFGQVSVNAYGVLFYKGGIYKNDGPNTPYSHFKRNSSATAVDNLLDLIGRETIQYHKKSFSILSGTVQVTNRANAMTFGTMSYGGKRYLILSAALSLLENTMQVTQMLEIENYTEESGIVFSDYTGKTSSGGSSSGGGTSGGGGTSITSHSQLTGRDAEDSHPASAITGLSSFMSAFNEMFVLEGSGTSASPYVIKAKHDLYSLGGLSAYGQGSGGGGGGSATWGAIVGTLADQTDLANALAGKAASSHTHTKSQITDFPTIPTITWGTAGSDYVPLTVNGTTKNLLTAHQSLSAYLTTAAAESTYLKLSGGTMTDALNVATGQGVKDASGNGLIVYHPTSWNGISNTQWGCGAIDCQGVIRSNASDLIHYKGGTNYTIYDSGNCNLTTVDWSCKALTMAGALSGATSILIAGGNSYYAAIEMKDAGIDSGYLYIQPRKEGTGYKNTVLNSLGGNVGIGTTSPSYKLHVAGNVGVNGSIYGLADNVQLYNKNSQECFSASVNWTVVGNGTAAAGLNTFVDGNNIYLRTGTSHANTLVLTSAGYAGIGIDSPAQKLDVVGKLRLRCSSDSTKYVDLEIDSSGNLKINGNIYATGGVTAYQSA